MLARFRPLSPVFPALALVALAALAACGGEDKRAYPALVPAGTVLGTEEDVAEPAPGLTARGDALRARAAQIRNEPL